MQICGKVWYIREVACVYNMVYMEYNNGYLRKSIKLNV